MGNEHGMREGDRVRKWRYILPSCLLSTSPTANWMVRHFTVRGARKAGNFPCHSGLCQRLSSQHFEVYEDNQPYFLTSSHAYIMTQQTSPASLTNSWWRAEKWQAAEERSTGCGKDCQLICLAEFVHESRHRIKGEKKYQQPIGRVIISGPCLVNDSKE